MTTKTSTTRPGRRTAAGIDTSARAAKLDQQTPKWPDLRLSITHDTSTLTISGITHHLDDADPQQNAVQLAAAAARTNGKPIRMTATMAGGDVHRMIVTADGLVTLLDHSRPAAPPAGHTEAAPDKATPGRKSKLGTSGSRKASKKASNIPILRDMTPKMRRVITWAGAVFLVLLLVLLTVAIIKGPHHPSDEAAASSNPQDHPAAPAATLYTVTPPPGWSQTASWAVAIADGATPVTDPDTGVTLALTPDNRSTTQTATDTAAGVAGHLPSFLSVLEPDGRTRFAEPLPAGPLLGPVVATVDGTKVALLQEDSTSLTYWPLAGGAPTTVSLPAGVSGQLDTTGPSVMVQLDNDRVAYLHHGAFQILDALPRTTPMFALDGSVISIQPDTGAWWTQRIDAAPTDTRPVPPVGATGIDQVIAITPQHAILTWKSKAPAGSTGAPDIAAAYDTATGKLVAQATTQNVLSPAQAVYSSPQHGLTAVDGLVLSTPAGQPARLTLLPGLHVTAVQDVVYGQDQGNPVTISAAGTATALPASTLTPTGVNSDRLMVISQDQLYALPAGPPSTALPLPTPTFVITNPTPVPAAHAAVPGSPVVHSTPGATPTAKSTAPTPKKAAAAPVTKPTPTPAKPQHRTTTAPTTTGTKP